MSGGISHVGRDDSDTHARVHMLELGVTARSKVYLSYFMHMCTVPMKA